MRQLSGERYDVVVIGGGAAGTAAAVAAARASWPMEVHEAPGRSRFVPMGGAGFFDIPRDALKAQGVDNLHLAGQGGMI